MALPVSAGSLCTDFSQTIPAVRKKYTLHILHALYPEQLSIYLSIYISNISIVLLRNPRDCACCRRLNIACAERTPRTTARGAAAGYRNLGPDAQPRPRWGRRHASGSQTTSSGPKPIYPVKLR